MIIYKITNKVNGNFYIGKTTKSIEERFKRHCQLSKNGKTYLYRAMRKYGIENFTVDVLEKTIFLDEKEKYWISKLNPIYNMTSGGDGGDTSNSPNYKLAMSKRDISGNKNPMFGRKRPDTRKFLLSAKEKMILSNQCPVICEGIKYDSVGAAEKAYPGISIRKRLDNPRYPEFFRLRERTQRKRI